MSRSRFLGPSLVAASFAFAAQQAGCASGSVSFGSGGAGGAGAGSGGAGGATAATSSHASSTHGSSHASSTSGAPTGAGGSAGGGGGAAGAPATCIHQADCKALNDACNVGNCVNNVCVQTAMNDGATCDDGLFCDVADSCLQGVCTGVPKVCPAPANACEVATCDEASKSCVTAAGNDGASCALANNVCFIGGACSNGNCVGTTPVDCSALDDACHTGVCDPVNGCQKKPANQGGGCDDGLFCTVNDTCNNGVCAGKPNLCGGQPNDPCLTASCDEVAKTCTSVPGNNGAACPSPNGCLVSATCNNGVCAGGVAGNNGAACSDGNKCDVGTTCTAGVCGNPSKVVMACVDNDGCCPAACTYLNDNDCQQPLFSKAAYPAALTFQDALMTTTMTMAWDGASYWSCSGGSSSGVRYAQYSAGGAVLGTYSPGIDFRSVFSLAGNGTTLYSRGYSSNQIEVQSSPGVFAPSLTLIGGTLDAQAAVALSPADQFVAFTAGTVTLWDKTGVLVSSFALNGFTGAENTSPQNRGIVAAGGYYLTYNATTLSAWDATGTRLKTTTLTGAGVSFDSYYSLSYANGMVWIVDVAGGTWRGYAVDL